MCRVSIYRDYWCRIMNSRNPGRNPSRTPSPSRSPRDNRARASGRPDLPLSITGVAFPAVHNYDREVKTLSQTRNRNPDFLDKVNTLATQIHDDKTLTEPIKQFHLTILDSLERDAILEQIKKEDKVILRLFQSAQPMTHESLRLEDKRSLQDLILLFAPDILNEELNHMYRRDPEFELKKAAKLAELLSIYMNLLERLLPTFFGAHPTDPNRLFIPNTTRNAQGEFVNREEALMVDLAMRAVYQYMVQIKSIGGSASAIADVVVPRTAEDIPKMLATFGLTIATLKAISPMLFQLINALATGGGLTVSDIRSIMTEAFLNAGYISAFLLWCNQNKEQITELAWKIFSKTLGRGMPEVPPPPPKDFKTLFSDLSKTTAAARIEELTGRRPVFEFDLSTGLDCVVYFTRAACVKQADLAASAFRQVPRGLQYLSNTCSRLAQRVVQAGSSYAVGLEATAGTVSPDTYNSFSDLLLKLAENAEYATLHANADFIRCMQLMQLNNPNPYRLNATRLQAFAAYDRMPSHEALIFDGRLVPNTTRADIGDSCPSPSTLEDGPVQRGTYIDPTTGMVSDGEVVLPGSAAFERYGDEGHKPSIEYDSWLRGMQLAAAQKQQEATGSGFGSGSAFGRSRASGASGGFGGLGGFGGFGSGPAFGPASGSGSGSGPASFGSGFGLGGPPGRPGRRGGRSRSRKRSVSKRTRRKGLAKKQKSNKNKLQSRRKVHRASSRRSHK